MAHEDFRRIIQVKDREYEAVGFLKDGELPVDGHTMLSRTAGENGGAIGEEDYRFILDHGKEVLQREFQQCFFVTSCSPPTPEFSNYAIILRLENSILSYMCSDLDGKCGDEHHYVLRRVQK